jgi:large subunit ribosomal protein L25
MDITVECQKRPEGKKANALRRSGLIPAVLYGHKGTESVSLTLDAKEAETLVRNAAVNNTLIQVKVPEISWSGKALLREVQSHPWKNNLYHLSFFSIAAQDTVEVVVPINLVGESEGAKQGGILEQVVTELQVQCAPESIPESIEIDISGMDIGSSMNIHEIVLPPGITVMDDPERTAVTVVAPTVAAAEEEEAVSEEVASVMDAYAGGEEEEAEAQEAEAQE